MSYRRRYVVLTSPASKRNTISLAGRILKKGIHVLRTGYWHTGERCCPDYADGNFTNHFKVYRFASQFCDGKDVLDVGCGTGYGSSFLAGSARLVVGIDVSKSALRYARAHYQQSNLSFHKMNAEALEFADQKFDFIISTENFEHLRDQRANLREMSRVLKDDGTLLLATPNHEMFVGENNPYHTHEITYEELLQMVRGFFSEYVIAENLLQPSTKEGLHMKEERIKKRFHGAELMLSPFLWESRIDTTWLSNTHSFFCFAKSPLRPANTN